MLRNTKKDTLAQSMIEIDLNKCLAKTETENNIVFPGMSVEQHCLLSGYVSRYLSKVFPYLVKEGLFLDGYDSIVALHDIGKISIAFQWIIYSKITNKDLIPDFLIEPNFDTSSSDLKHPLVGQAYINDELSNYKVAQIVANHHGFKPHKTGMTNDEVFGGVQYNKGRKELQKVIENSLNSKIPNQSLINYDEQAFLTGLTVVSDWISSARSLSELKESNYDELAYRAVQEAGFEIPKVVKGLSFESIFGFPPNNSQRTFYELASKPGVYILEVEMGQGKTEAALYVAYKLLEKGESTGFYFALPTKLTSVSIHKRVEAFLDKILQEHKKTKLIFQNSNLYDCKMGEDCSVGGDWFDSTKRSILYPFGVGTIDQALMSIINVKHSALRSFGLAGKTMIIDELHSYDVYTGSLVRKLIEHVVALKGTVLVLSATLQDLVKNQILGTNLQSSSYPLASGLVNREYVSKEITINSNKRILIRKTDYNSAIEKAIDAYYEGQNVLWIENTVEEAQKAYRIFVARVDNTENVGLLHSLYTEEDRQKNEDKWLTYFGKDNKYRKCGSILVGTQVLEQSLDIDADVLFTKIAPIDMLLQRIGRLWRHPCLNQYRKTDEPICYVVCPKLEDSTKNPRGAFEDSGYVYSPYVLFRTLKIIEHVGTVIIPQDIKTLINSVYSDEAPENNEISSLLYELKAKKTELEKRADFASSNIENTEFDDFAKTRVSDIPTISVLILKEYDIINNRIKFMDNHEYNLDKHNKNFIARKILKNIVKVSIKKVIKAQSNDYVKPLTPFIYISDNPNERIRIMTINEQGELDGIVLNEKKIFHYSHKLGYYKDEEKS